MSYEVFTSETAEAEAEEAYLWLNRLSPKFAGRWYDGLLDAVATLDTFPNRCPLAPENDDFPDSEVRQLIYRNGRTIYRILFCVIEPNLVRVLHIRHSARRYGGPDMEVD